MISASRNAYQKEFDELLADAWLHGGVLVLHGGPGTGKTTLLREFRERALAADALCLTAVGFRNESCLPFTVVEQLGYCPGAPRPVVSALERLVAHGAPRDPRDHGHVARLRELTAALGETARRGRLVLLVDDLHYTDNASRDCLLHLARRACASGIVMVMTYGRALHEGSVERSEFETVPGCRLVEASPLSLGEVRLLLEAEWGAGAAERLHESCHRVSGGSPALVLALIQDHRPAEAARTGTAEMTVGNGFRGAYLTRLSNHPTLLSCVRAAALLDRDASAERVARLLARDTEAVAGELAELVGAGLLLTGGRFRHPAARAAVLEGPGGTERARLRLRAAQLLRADGAPPTTVAEHLVAAGEVPDETGVAVLLRAAWQWLAEGRADAASRCLRLADRAGLDPDRREHVTLGLVSALWCVNPAAAEPEIARLMAAVRAGTAEERTLHGLIDWLLWFGRSEEATEAIARLRKVYDPDAPHGGYRLTATRAMVAQLRPDALADLPVPERQADDAEVAAISQGTTASPVTTASSVTTPSPVITASPITTVTADITGTVPEQPAPPSVDHAGAPGGQAELVQFGLELSRAGTVLQLPAPFPEWQLLWEREITALLGLAQHGHLTMADQLGRGLLARFPAGSPARHALLRGIHAWTAVQRGDMRTAVAHASGALDELSPHSWGVAIGSPLSSLVIAHTAMGQLDEAARYLELPVPEAMSRSVFGLFHLVGRGYHALAAGRPYAALSDFTACAPLAERWRPPSRHLFDWRTGAAEAFLALGERDRARDLAERQLDEIGTVVCAARGDALRTLAATGPVAARRLLLDEAVQVLRACDSRLSLARVLSDLSEVHLDAGHTERARALWREAQGLARQAGARTPHWTARTPSAAEAARPPAPVRAPAPAAAALDERLLSEAEWRVAALASEGKSNRQIARHLYITVSTVEQHLTRVYRKLSVRRRAELSQLIRPVASETGPLTD
ncbi:hypothetical protein GCM10009654_17600 [Streptomyces hebeiensis]|uniref:HTH luxR-type domain-containing protein n=1 Tax=Streptomyces hebeiensis TaxID=229486 RepID=A0ABN1UQI2_9ACTN